MSFLARSRPPDERSTIDAIGQAARYSQSTYGTFVTEDSSLRHDAVWSCRTRIAQDVSMMPVDVIRYLPNGTKQEVEPPQIIAAPSVFGQAIDWRYQVVDSWLANGNAWGLVTETTRDLRYPTRIELLSPNTVRPRLDDAKTFMVTGHGDEQLWPVGRLWHVPAYTLAGKMLGLSPIEYHRATIGKGLAAEQFGKSFFDGGGHPVGIIAAGANPGEDGARDLKQRFLEAVNGANREPIVLPKDTTYMPLQIKPDDSQFIETERYTVEQVCRIFGEDPADHGGSGGGSSITYANRSDAELARFKRRQFWVTKMQLALSALIEPPLRARLNTSSMLMMTARERHELHALRLKSETIAVNEVRVIEDEKPFDDPIYDQPGLTKPQPAVVGSASSD